MTAPSDEDPRPRPGELSWHVQRTARVTLAAALVVGLVAGAYGWERWQQYSAAASARSLLDLHVSTMSMTYPSESQVTLGIRYRNDGEFPVVIKDAAVTGPGLRTSSAAERLTLDPGETSAHLLTVTARCTDDGPPDGLPQLTVEAETADGLTRTVELDAGLDADLSGMIIYWCEDEELTAFDAAYAETTSVLQSADGSAIRASITIWADGDDAVVTDVAIADGPFAITYEAGPISSAEQSVPVSVEYRVASCAAGPVGAPDLTLRVVGSVGGETGVLSVPPTAELAVAAVRLHDRVCAG